MSRFPLYPQQLRSIVNILEGLDAIDAKPMEGTDVGIQLRANLEVISAADDDLVIGHVKDEIGGAWHFEPLVTKDSV